MSYEELVEKFSGRLKAICNRVYRKDASLSADDLYQEALVYLWKRYLDKALEDKTDSYILQGCYYHIRNYLRTAQKRKDEVSLDAPVNSSADLTSDYLWEISDNRQEDYFERLNTQLISEAIYNNGLTQREKEILLLLAEGLSTRQIGRKLSISHVSVIKYRRIILKKCKKHLE
ncbi:MAG: sigma-70 family RNA polymerase sigma factor [Candidatus Omnitrophica bacterium]|nr:sigma-70 family RNA polymerase sigma factor [Candidatus Omnitrophota bacterium]